MHLRKIVIFLAASVLVACQPTTPIASTSTPQVVETQTPSPTVTPVATSSLGVQAEALRGVTVDVWYPWFGTPASLFESQVETFNNSNPWGILVRAESLQNYAELFDQVNARLDTSDGPDMVIGLPEYALVWDKDETVVDLTPYVSDAVYGLSNSEISDFPSVFWAQDQLGERRLGVPAQRTARFLLYNQTWAEELGFSSAPRTAEEFREQACRANQFMRSDADPQNDGIGGWLVDTDPMTALSWLRAFGGGAEESDGLRFLTPKNIEAMRFVKGLSEDSCAWQTRDEIPLSNFVDRSALFATASLEELPDLARAFAAASNTDKWTVLVFPGPEGHGLVMYGSSYILLDSEDTEQLAAWLFVRWLLSTENQAKWVQSAGLFPLQASTMNLLSDYAAGHPQWEAAVNLIPLGQTTPKVAAWRTVRVALGDGVNFMFRVGTPVGQVPAILAQLDAVVADLSE